MRHATNRFLLLIETVVLAGFVIFTTPVLAADLTPAEARSIAKDVYIYGFPIVEKHKIGDDFIEFPILKMV